tara:strand:+ start:1838 stop:2116 length:279 start_codon:yes stop_codon:yes gene_type:complete
MGKFSQRVGQKAKAAGRIGLKVGAVAGAGALAYLASKKGSDSDGSVDVAQVARDMRKAEIEGLMDDYNREHGTDIGQRKNKSYRRERGLPEN